MKRFFRKKNATQDRILSDPLGSYTGTPEFESKDYSDDMPEQDSDDL